MSKFSSWDLCGPDPNPMTREEVEKLKELTNELPVNAVIVNIGAERGTSTLAMLEERPRATLFSIDINEDTTELDNIKRAGLVPPNYCRVLGKSQEVSQDIGGLFDLVFVDGDHSYKGVKGDIEAFRRRVVVGGYLVFHDYIPDPIPDHIKGRAAYAIDEWRETDTDYEEVAWVHRLKAYKRL